MDVLSQRDSRWKDIKLGTSKITTIGSHGCTITCVAMLAGLTPDEVNRRLISVNGYALTNLIIWSKIQEAIPWLEFEWRGYSYENDKVLKAIEDNGGCLVEVDFDGTPKTNDKHWVLFTGDKKMSDPWTGTVESTSKYSPLTGYSIIKVKEDMAELPPEYGDMVWKSTQHDDTVKYIWGNDVNPRQKSSKDIQQYIGGLKSQITTLQNKLAVSEAEVNNRIEQVSRLEVEIANKEKQIKDLSAAYNSITQEINSLRVSCEADKKLLQESLDNCSKEKGQLEKDKAELKAENERLKKEVGTPLEWHEHFVLAIRKLLGVL